MLLHLKCSHIGMNLEKEQLPTPVFWPGESMDHIVHGVTKSRTQLHDFHAGMKERRTAASVTTAW